jgi:hypothetical protein
MHLSEVMTIVIAFHDRGYISQKLFGDRSKQIPEAMSSIKSA